MEKSISIFFADDNDLWRETLVKELRSFKIQCTGQARDGRELLNLLKKNSPDVVLLDLSMPVMDGNIAMDAIRENYPEVKVIILSMHNEEELVDDYIARGAWGYIPKDVATVEILAEGIQTVYEARIYTYKLPMVRKKYTARQVSMIPMMCEGLTNKEIAEEIGISERGVEKQRQKIYEKAGAQKAVDFYKYAFRQGLDFLYRSVQLRRR